MNYQAVPAVPQGVPFAAFELFLQADGINTGKRRLHAPVRTMADTAIFECFGQDATCAELIAPNISAYISGGRRNLSNRIDAWAILRVGDGIEAQLGQQKRRKSSAAASAEPSEFITTLGPFA
jgi:hypothetical protein